MSHSPKWHGVIRWTAAAVVTLFVAFSVLMTELSNWFFRDSITGAVIRSAPPWVSWLIAAVVAIALFAAAKAPSRIRLAAVVLALLAYALSVRMIAIIFNGGYMSEHWSGIELSEVIVDTNGYTGFLWCYTTAGTRLTVHAPRTEPVVYFRGIWPFVFSESDLSREFHIERCGTAASDRGGQ